MPSPHVQYFGEYFAFQKNACWYDVDSMTPRMRCAYLHAVRVTFQALSLCAPPDMAEHLDSPASKQIIKQETKKWMVGCFRMPPIENWYWRLLYDTPFQASYERNPALLYLLGNIGGACPMLIDVTEALGEINQLCSVTHDRPCPLYRSIRCMPFPLRLSRGLKPPDVWMHWLCTDVVDTIAKTSFALGWERRLIEIVGELAFEIIGRMDDIPNRKAMLLFLQNIKTKAMELRDNEIDIRTLAAIHLRRIGIVEDGIVKMLIGPQTRYGDIPIALMPRYLRLPKRQFPWGFERHPRLSRKIREHRRAIA